MFQENTLHSHPNPVLSLSVSKITQSNNSIPVPSNLPSLAHSKDVLPPPSSVCSLPHDEQYLPWTAVELPFSGVWSRLLTTGHDGCVCRLLMDQTPGGSAVKDNTRVRSTFLDQVARFSKMFYYFYLMLIQACQA